MKPLFKKVNVQQNIDFWDYNVLAIAWHLGTAWSLIINQNTTLAINTCK